MSACTLRERILDVFPTMIKYLIKILNIKYLIKKSLYDESIQYSVTLMS